MAFTIFEQQLIKLLKHALKTPKSVSEVELLISIKLLLKPLRYLLVNRTKKVVGVPEIQILLREIGVFSTNEDMSLHLFASAGTLDNLEGLSEAGDAMAKESYYHANRLLSWSSSNLNATDRLSVNIGRKLQKPKSQPRRISKSITDFFDRDPLLKLRECVSRPIFAIDSATAHEIDDAVSIEDDWLHIHIADPTSYIPHYHPLTQIARMRANSAYLPHRHYPLLPTALSDNLFNLGVTAKALTFSAKLDWQGRIVDYMVTPSHLENVKRLTYDDVNTVLDWSNLIPGAPTWATGQLEKRNSTKSSKITLLDAALLSKIQQITWEHRKRRLEQNAIIQDQYSNNIRLLEAPLDVSPLQVQESFQTNLFSQQTNIEINADDIPERSPSCILVQEAMIIAGRVAAKYCSERNLPVAYRGQECPDGIAPSSLYQNALLNRHETSGALPLKYLQPLFPYMRPAYMSRTPQAHSSLGLLGLGQNTEFPGYLKVTSPLRRFQDMVFHYQIQNSLLGINPPFSESHVYDITVHTEDFARRTNSLSKRSIRYWTLEYLRSIADPSGNWSQQFAGIVSISTTLANSKVSVSVPALAGLIGPCLVSKTVEDGEEVMVSIEKADPFSGQVIFRATS